MTALLPRVALISQCICDQNNIYNQEVLIFTFFSLRKTSCFTASVCAKVMQGTNRTNKHTFAYMN